MSSVGNALGTRLRGTRLLLVVGAVAVGTVAGCSAGEKVLDQSYVETTVAHQLAEQVDQPVPKVTCPDDLEAKVGATMECTLVPQGETTKYPVHVEVTSVNTDDKTAKFSAEVGDAPS
ncbi:MAG: hypothetical protein QOH68_1477 [Nocardioidaceae bacterium]|nr:hypothetical protein [Nocardioidaceae bacterium]